MRNLRNVTITLDDEVARWARILAARENTSVSRLLGEMLRERMLQEEGYERAMRAYLSRGPYIRKRKSPYPSRESLHERSGLR